MCWWWRRRRAVYRPTPQRPRKTVIPARHRGPIGPVDYNDLMPLFPPVATVAHQQEADETTSFLPVQGFDDSSEEECGGGGTFGSSEEEPCSPVSDGYYTPDDTIEM